MIPSNFRIEFLPIRALLCAIGSKGFKYNFLYRSQITVTEDSFFCARGFNGLINLNIKQISSYMALVLS